MIEWPAPESYEKTIPGKDEPGSFWEETGGKYNCGIDIFAPEGSPVVAPEGGRVIDNGRFTDSHTMPYFNDTNYIIIRTSTNLFLKLASLGNVYAKTGDIVRPGQKIGDIRKIVDDERIYNLIIHNNFILNSSNRNSYLHIELTKPPIMQVRPYLAGYFTENARPYSLINPEAYLNAALSEAVSAA